jgi:hypothetical protein
MKAGIAQFTTVSMNPAHIARLFDNEVKVLTANS